MKAFLWHEIQICSDNYHSGGSVIIEAETLERAREIGFFLKSTWKTVDGVFYEKMPDEKIPMTLGKEPDAIYETTGTVEKVWVFPNAGCC